MQADLCKPETVAAAVRMSGAKRAFIYLAHGSSDHMKATLEALKSAGIEFVVFLSSFTVGAEPRDVVPSEFIPYIHAQVEINLEEVFGRERFVAVRPGAFATNILRYKSGIVAEEVRIYGAHVEQDYITPVDMGRVSGTILVSGPRNGQQIVYLYGPQILAQGDAIKAAGKVLGKDVKVISMNEHEAIKQFEANHVPKPMAEYMVRKLGESSDGDVLRFKNYAEGVENVRLYTGRQATGLEEWIKANQGLFAS